MQKNLLNITFPFKGQYHEFLTICFDSLNKSVHDFPIFDASTIKNLLRTSEPTSHSLDSVEKVYKTFEIQRLTGRSLVWLFLFAQRPTEGDPYANPFWKWQQDSLDMEDQAQITANRLIEYEIQQINAHVQQIEQHAQDVKIIFKRLLNILKS